MLLALQVSTCSLTVNEEIIAVEVVRTLVGSIGILLAVPARTAIAAWFAGRPAPAQPAVGSAVDAVVAAPAD